MMKRSLLFTALLMNLFGAVAFAQRPMVNFSFNISGAISAQIASANLAGTLQGQYKYRFRRSQGQSAPLSRRGANPCEIIGRYIWEGPKTEKDPRHGFERLARYF
jgi:hypothetical protein